MKQETVTYTLYKFDELSDEAKEKAVQKFYDINTQYQWWEFTYEGIREDLKELGLECKDIYFDIDRNSHIELTNLHFTSVSKFIENGIETGVKKSLIEIADLYISSMNINRHTKNVIESYSHTSSKHQRLNKAIDSLVDRCNDKLHSLLEDFRIRLQKEYEYLSSEEAIIDSIKCNEYDFLEDGSLY